jgi:hypothetical protein
MSCSDIQKAESQIEITPDRMKRSSCQRKSLLKKTIRCHARHLRRDPDRSQGIWLSEEERRVDAWALGAEERRDKLRKAAGRSKYPVIRGCLNGETRLRKPQPPYDESIVIRGEPPELKHLSRERKRKKHRFSE